MGFAGVLVVGALFVSGKKEPTPKPESPATPNPDETIKREVQAAKIMEATLAARDAPPAEWQKLEKIYIDLEAKYPASADVKNARAEFIWSMGDEEGAVRKWEAALADDAKHPVVLEHLGGGWLAAGDVKKAAAYYRRAVESMPQNAEYTFTLANVTFLFRKELIDSTYQDESAVLDRALALFAEASRLQPLSVHYARSYAETFYSLPKPDWKAALTAWQHFAEISPQADFAQINLARIHLKLGQKDAAKACLDKVQTQEYQRIKAKLAERIATE